MTHWTQPYIGLRYDAERHNCAQFMASVARDQLGLDVTLPGDQEWRGKPPGVVADLGVEYASPTDSPREFDIVLMEVIGRKRFIGSHIGIHAKVDGNPWVLHNIQYMGVTFVPETTLNMVFLRRVGYYQWHST